MLISRDDFIADVVKKYPQTIAVFLDFGLYCISCAASVSETISSGVLGHGKSEEELEDLLKKLEGAASTESETVPVVFSVSEEAAAKLLEIQSADRALAGKKYLRISCPQKSDYTLEFTNVKGEKDVEFFCSSLCLLVDNTSLALLSGLEMSYKSYSFGEGFVFEKKKGI
ncbi:DUF1858 domain-containing protein [Candidatus Woesearchaeota archaeon]|nr:DUF1858 domain-containing protein [Nanoarchaeota archaeon]MCB9370892.1 DUF1858 domain-containing protein [Candidatus Woesearchaeota archaeon]USN43993.1 MAG: DUF1858 domain-containing protein [Candidatus Woesearchaeota archaeon]